MTPSDDPRDGGGRAPGTVAPADPRYPARCRDCGTGYRVPRRDRAYACRSCGGTVRARGRAREAQPIVLEHSATCSECQAINPGGMDYCVECGTTLEPSAPAPGSDAAARVRHESQATLERAKRMLTRVLLGYRFGAVAYAVATLFAILGLARPDVPAEGGALVVGLTTSMCLLLWVGSLHLPFHPFGWTLSVAVCATAVSIAHFRGPNPYGVAAYASAAWALAAWIGLVPSLRFGHLIHHHKDLYILHHASLQTRRALKNRSAHERHVRLLAAMRRAARRAWKGSVIGASVFALASYAGTRVVLERRPQVLDPALESFEAAWNAGDLDGVADKIDPRVREVELQRLTGNVYGHGWSEALPPLGEHEIRRSETDAEVGYDVDGVPLDIDWLRVDTEWHIARIELPIPSIDPTLDRFREAWASSDVDAVVQFFGENARAAMRTNIESAARERGWERYPDIASTTMEEDGEKRWKVTFGLATGNLTTEWHYRVDGRWRMHGIRIPAR